MTGHAAPAVNPAHLTEIAEVDAVLARLPTLGGHERRVSRLDGGLTNRNYHVVADSGAQYVARLSSEKSALLGIDRAAEFTNSRIAASAGVGPAVVDFAPNDSVLVVQWIDGHTFTDADLDDDAQLTRVASVCRALHAAPRFVGDFDMFDVQQRYLDIVREFGFRLPEDYLDFEPQVRLLERVLRGTSTGTVPCHNDLLAANIIDDGERLWLIDYEYSGNNDACFELGNIWSEADLATERLEHLVSEYFGAPSPVQTARARLFGLMAKYGWTLWASIQDAVSDAAFDFWDWGMAKYARACAEFRSTEFDDLISTITGTTTHEEPTSD